MIAPQRNNATGIVTIDNEPVIFHCNHYNRVLQLVVEDCHYIKREPILINAAVEVSFRQMRAHFDANPGMNRAARLAYAEEFYRFCGFGNLPIAGIPPLPPEGVVIEEAFSHYGCALRLNYGKRRWAGDYFDLGFAVGVLAAVDGIAVTGQIDQAQSISMGAENSRFHVAPATEGRFPLDTPPITPVILPPRADQVPVRTVGLHIDESAIIAAVGSLPLLGDENGMIPAFGVFLTRHYADYYNLVSFRYERALAEALKTHKYLSDVLWFEYPALFYYKDKFSHLKGMELASTLLIEAGHICGFNTMGGIMRSEPWYQLIVPQLRTKEDWVSGVVACINALGWGVWRIHEIIPNERLVLRAWHPYESLGHLRLFGKADHPIDYLFTGIGGSLMNLLYSADITTKPDLTLDFYYKVNRSKSGFWGRQTACVAMGDAYSEVVVERNIL
ncbi:MAG: hypothetical protein POG74_00225 [Acidocella sp.]|nr:hypothetical protein [Acidocella sp.]